jgi:hypothetical protein
MLEWNSSILLITKLKECDMQDYIDDLLDDVMEEFEDDVFDDYSEI